MDAAKLKGNVQKHLDKIGGDKATGLPDNVGDNLPHEPAAWELMIAGIIRSYGEKRYDNAKKAAEEAGILGKSADAVPGSKTVTYDGAYVSVIRSVNNASDKLDNKKFIAELRKRGVKQDVIDDAMLHATTPGTPAKRFEAVPK